MRESTIIIIVGPTAVGKTAAAIRLARQEQTQIISADSRQCYRELNIGVAKPSKAELDAVHHYFINSHSIREEVNAAVFEELALQWTADIFRKAPTAVMVGGTGLYVKAFTDGLDDIPAVDPAIRRQLQQQYELNGIGWLQQEVRLHDPAFYAEGERQNPQRLLRALEVRLSTGRSILSFRSGTGRVRPFLIRKIGLELPKEELHRHIHERVDQMIDQGLVEEVKGLLPYRNHNALRTVGYKEIFEYLDGWCSLDEAIANIKINTRRYAKRQLTWFRKDPDIQWIRPDDALKLTRS
ncbi:MAG TPA: tRNA (adenosine(37)-N6)-dimethylallyltransferase MiaA [Puia sp.]|nr:tRNA (adenosine(37)-N6)-dimethylallyltransferase MiaA [Puia sp.]